MKSPTVTSPLVSPAPWPLKALPPITLIIEAGLFFALLTRLLPQLLTDHRDALAQTPALEHVAALLLSQPFICTLLLGLTGGVCCILGPRHEPLRLTAWFLAAGFLLCFLLTLLVLVPQTCFYVDAILA